MYLSRTQSVPQDSNLEPLVYKTRALTIELGTDLVRDKTGALSWAPRFLRNIDAPVSAAATEAVLSLTLGERPRPTELWALDIQ